MGLEEQVRRVRLERQVAELVDDQELRLREAEQLLVETLLSMRLGEPRDQRHGRRELHRVAGQDCLATERDGKVRLADPRRTSVIMPGVWDLRSRSSTRSIPDAEPWWLCSPASSLRVRRISLSGSLMER